MRLRNFALLAAFAIAGVLGARACRRDDQEPAKSSPPVDISGPAPRAPVDDPVAKFGVDIWPLLDKCLHEAPAKSWVHSVTVEQVRKYVEVEHDPYWYDGPPNHGAWWLPLTGEGQEGMPSGQYISVPIDGAPCGGAIVN
jgi:hypothetical protein